MFLLSWMTGSEAGHAQSALSEPQVKALFLFNFAKYVEWPTQAFSDTNSPITIGILGASPCGQYLQKAVEGKSVGGRSIVVRRIEQLEDVRVCQILFIAETEKKRTGELLGQVRTKPILTVGESEHFAEQGGIIGFMMNDGKVRLAIDLKAARQASLQISSKLLSVADTVTGRK